MSTFSGQIIKEPGDLATQLSQRDIIDACDDPQTPTAIGVDLIASLTVPQAAEIIPIANEIIAEAEGTVNAYAMSYGYGTPLLGAGAAPDPVAKGLMARIVKLRMQERKHSIGRDDAIKEFDAIQVILSGIQSGKVVLGAVLAMESATGRRGGIGGVSSAERIFSRESLRGF